MDAVKKSDPKEVVEMRESLSEFSQTARRVVRGARDSQRRLRLPLSARAHVATEDEPGYTALTPSEVREAQERLKQK